MNSTFDDEIAGVFYLATTFLHVSPVNKYGVVAAFHLDYCRGHRHNSPPRRLSFLMLQIIFLIAKRNSGCFGRDCSSDLPHANGFLKLQIMTSPT